jgi:hypothetical protein
MLTKSFLQTTKRTNLMFSMAARGFAVKEYDLAIIGGGPGGKLDLLFL